MNNKLLIFAALAFSALVFAEVYTDPRDNKSYKIVDIGGNTWMAQNLDYKTKGSFCYNNDENFCESYGRLYTFDAAQQACPDGWHLATAEDWESLASATKGKSLKLPVDWHEDGNGKNDTRFSGAPAGFRNSKGKFELFGKRADFWSSNEEDESNGKYWYLSFKNEKLEHNKYSKKGALSVRCVKGSAPEDESDVCELGSMDQGETWEIIKTKNYITCAEAHNYGCGWHPEGISATYTNTEKTCDELMWGEDERPIETKKIIDYSKATNAKLRRILNTKDPSTYLDSLKICVYDSEKTANHDEKSDDEICIPFAEARSFLTPYGRKLLE